jgi:hypothetical protein
VIWFVVFAVADGAILRTGRCPEGQAEAQAAPGEAVLAFAEPQTFAGPAGVTLPITDLTHRVEGGALVPVES